MDLDLSDDQQLFVETTRRFLESECPITEVRRLGDTDEGFDRSYWSRAADLGWTAAMVAEADGGGSVSGNGLLDLALVAEEMGRLVSPGPLVGVNVVADAVARSGTDEQRGSILPGLVAGDSIASWAFAESDEAWVPPRIEASASEIEGGWLLEGTKTFVEAAGVCDLFLATARTGSALTQFLVPADAPGVEVTPLGSLDLTRRFGKVHFRSVRLPTDAVLGEVGGAGSDVERQLRVAVVLDNAETVGAISTVVDFTIEYAKDRMAFGRPIGSYQALKHRFADLRTWVEACAATSAASARAVQDDAHDADELISVAKSYVSERAPAIVQDCIQLHGGIGVTWEHDLHLYLRRVAQNAQLYGSFAEHRERLASLIGM
jgi:alkylation response protein AidB-like acyl-CoA dehydrogenase